MTRPPRSGTESQKSASMTMSFFDGVGGSGGKIGLPGLNRAGRRHGDQLRYRGALAACSNGRMNTGISCHRSPFPGSPLLIGQ